MPLLCYPKNNTSTKRKVRERRKIIMQETPTRAFILNESFKKQKKTVAR